MANIVERKVVVMESRGLEAVENAYRRITAEGDKLDAAFRRLAQSAANAGANVLASGNAVRRATESMDGAASAVRDMASAYNDLSRSARSASTSRSAADAPVRSRSASPSGSFDLSSVAGSSSAGKILSSYGAGGPIAALMSSLEELDKTRFGNLLAVPVKLAATLINPLGLVVKLGQTLWNLPDTLLRVGKAAVVGLGQMAAGAAKTLYSWAQMATKAALGLAAAGTAVGVAFTVASVKAAITRDTQMRAITSLAGSASEASRIFKQLQDLSLLPGTTLNANIQFTKQLMAVGTSAEFAMRMLKEMANANALNGGGESQMELASLQLMQMIGKGKVMGEDIRQISNSLPQFRQALVKAFGGMDPEDIGKSGIPIMEVLRRTFDQMEKTIPRATSGPYNAIVNLKNAWTNLLVAFGKPFTGAAGIRVIESIASGLDRLQPLFERLGTWMASSLPSIGRAIESAFAYISNPDNLGKWAKLAVDAFTHVGLSALAFSKTALSGLRAFSGGLVSIIRQVGDFVAAWGRFLAIIPTHIAASWLGIAPKAGDIVKFGERLSKMSEDADAKMSSAFSKLETAADKAKDGLVDFQTRAKSAIDEATASIRAQAQALNDVADAAQRYTAELQSANGNSYKATSFGQAIAMQNGWKPQSDGFFNDAAFQSREQALVASLKDADIAREAGWNSGPLRNRLSAKLATTGDPNAAAELNRQIGIVDQIIANKKAREAQLATAEQEALQERIAKQEQSRRLWQEGVDRYNQQVQQYWQSAAGWMGNSLHDMARNAAAALREWRGMADMASSTALTPAQRQAVALKMAQNAERDALLGVDRLHGRLTPEMAKLAKLADDSESGKSAKNVAISGDYTKERQRDKARLGDSLTSQVIGNLGLGDQGILAQGRLGSATDRMVVAARRAGREIGDVIAEVIGYHLPREVEQAVARRMRLDYQGAS